MCNTTHAANDGGNTLDSQPKWAIIVVPGIFGSRLRTVPESSGYSLWNPDSDKWGVDAIRDGNEKRGRKMNVFTKRARPRWEDADCDYPNGIAWRRKYTHIHGRTDKKLKEDRLRRGFGTVSWGSYGDGIEALEKKFQTEAVVFVFGYDWRQDNWKSGGKLLEFIYFTVHGEFGIKFKPIVVTHSMGGLVTRAACCRFFDENTGQAVETETELKGENMIAGVVHTLMPTYGTPKAYNAFRHGWGDRFEGLAAIIGRTGKKFAKRCYATPSIYQLAPNQLYAEAHKDAQAEIHPKHYLLDKNGDQYWLHFEQAAFDKSDLSKKNWWLKFVIDSNDLIEKKEKGHSPDLVKQAKNTLRKVHRAWEGYSKDKTPDAFAELRKLLLRYPYLLYRDTSGFFGIPEWKHITKDSDEADRVKDCIDLAEQFHACRVGDYMHPETWVLYSTGDGTTIVGVTVSVHTTGLITKTESCKVVAKAKEEYGDNTVTHWSAAAFENKVRPPWNRRAKLLEFEEAIPLKDRILPSAPDLHTNLEDRFGDKVNKLEKCVHVEEGVAHDAAFKEDGCPNEIVQLVQAAAYQLIPKGFGADWVPTKENERNEYLARKGWAGRYKDVLFTVRAVWEGSKKKEELKTLMDRKDTKLDLSDRKRIRKLLKKKKLK